MFHNVSARYHKAVKRIARLYIWVSNNLAFESVGVNIFRDLQGERMFNFYLLWIKSENKSMISLKYCSGYNSFIRKIIKPNYFSIIMMLPMYLIIISQQ